MATCTSTRIGGPIAGGDRGARPTSSCDYRTDDADYSGRASSQMDDGVEAYLPRRDGPTEPDTTAQTDLWAGASSANLVVGAVPIGELNPPADGASDYPRASANSRS